ncbi:unnamed protein product [Effrenium voratum]|nr:unnamed protein product [Effrenium voratum]
MGKSAEYVENWVLACRRGHPMIARWKELFNGYWDSIRARKGSLDPLFLPDHPMFCKVDLSHMQRFGHDMRSYLVMHSCFKKMIDEEPEMRRVWQEEMVLLRADEHALWHMDEPDVCWQPEAALRKWLGKGNAAWEDHVIKHCPVLKFTRTFAQLLDREPRQRFLMPIPGRPGEYQACCLLGAAFCAALAFEPVEHMPSILQRQEAGDELSESCVLDVRNGYGRRMAQGTGAEFSAKAIGPQDRNQKGVSGNRRNTNRPSIRLAAGCPEAAAVREMTMPLSGLLPCASLLLIWPYPTCDQPLGTFQRFMLSFSCYPQNSPPGMSHGALGSECLTALAAEFIEEVAARDLSEAVGEICAQHLLSRVQRVYSALGGYSNQELADAVETLARDCVTLPEWVERDFEQEQTSEDFCWAFGPAAAEAAAAAAAAVAGLAEPGMLDDAQLVMSVLEAFALDLDCLTAYIYGGLCRTDKESGGNPDDSWERITRSLRAITCWTVAALGRTAGYERVSSEVLWELAGGDTLWAALLLRGALDAQPAPPQVSASRRILAAPKELPVLQQHLVKAFLGLHTPDVAFEVSEEDVAISERSVQLTKHRRQLGEDVAQVKLLPPLLRSSEAFGLQPELAAFLAAVSASSEALRGSLQPCAELWRHLSRAEAECLPSFRTFLCDCAQIALRMEAACAPCSELINKLLQLSAEPPSLATLAVAGVLATNAQLAVQDVPLLASSLAALSPEQRAETASLASRTAMRSGSWLMSSATPSAPEAPAEKPLPEPPGRLRQVLQDAPRQLRCAIDGRLTLDPVRSPSGFLYERAVLAELLARNGNLCPVTGVALALSSCRRDPEARKEALAWVRAQHSRPRRLQ